MNTKFSSKRPKYTTYFIVNEIEKVLYEYGSINEVLQKFKVRQDTISDILKKPRFFNLEMYEAAAKILNKDVNELISIEEDNLSPSFRKNSKCNENEIEIEKEFELANLLFNEIINNREMNV